MSTTIENKTEVPTGTFQADTVHSSVAFEVPYAVATFGGQEFPTVTIYMDGFYDGVQYYNQKHGKNVQVLGWNEKTQNGSFTGDFTNQTKGQTLTQTFISEGADIIFPVAGNVGLGAAKAVQQADAAAGSQKVNMMWVDVDGCVSAPQYCKYFITSVQKGIVAAVSTAVTSTANGSFKGGNYVGTLANGGVALAPFHDFDSQVSSALKNELAQVKAGNLFSFSSYTTAPKITPEDVVPVKRETPGINVYQSELNNPQGLGGATPHRCHNGANGSKGSEGRRGT